MINLPSEGDIIALPLGTRHQAINTLRVTSFGDSLIICNITFYLYTPTRVTLLSTFPPHSFLFIDPPSHIDLGIEGPFLKKNARSRSSDRLASRQKQHICQISNTLAKRKFELPSHLNWFLFEYTHTHIGIYIHI